MDQRQLAAGEGPIAVLAAPTRELAEQIHREARESQWAAASPPSGASTLASQPGGVRPHLALPTLRAARCAGRFGRPYNLVVCAAFGGLSKAGQFKELKGGAEVSLRQYLACWRCPD